MSFVIRMILIWVFMVAFLSGCASFPEAKVIRNPPVDQRVENHDGFIYPSDKDAVCSSSIVLSDAMRVGMLGFYAQRTQVDDATPFFIPPAYFVRVLVVRENGDVLVANAMRDEFLQAVFFNLPKGWCEGAVHAAVVSNDGASVQTSHGVVFGSLDALYNGRALHASVDIQALASDEPYRKNFFREYPSQVEIMHGIATLSKEDKEYLDALAKVTAKETMQETPEARIFRRTGFFVDFLEFLHPYGLPIKAAFWGKNAWQASNGHPHGFTPVRCFTSSELYQNAQYIHAKEEDWRQGQSLRCGIEFKPRELNDGPLRVIHQEGGDCVDPRTAATAFHRLLEAEYQGARQGAKMCSP